ncbi:UNVERIFIED_CONTAM: hypothetical protein GTU68_048776, partial [Idotea baltica]|nr:hypothetical protein [Idotea baltica]
IETIEGKADGTAKSFVIVAARWNELIVSRLIEGAHTTLCRQGVSVENQTLVRVPGSYEIPLAVEEVIRHRSPAGVIALGCLLEGETAHYDLISKNVVSALMSIGQKSGIPIGLGIICADTMDQAQARCGGKVGNYGSEAAAAVVEMSELQRRLALDATGSELSQAKAKRIK